MNLEMLSLITSLQYLKHFASVFYESVTPEQSFPEIFFCQTESHFSSWELVIEISMELVYDFKKKSQKIQSSYTENNIKKHFETNSVRALRGKKMKVVHQMTKGRKSCVVELEWA